jgi:cell wall-associated NlpC family hydrolase
MRNSTQKSFRHNFSAGFYPAILAALLLVTACATTQKQPDRPTLKSGISPAIDRPLHDDEIEKRLRAEYRKWQGTRHRMGGDGDNGIDCSGFVKAVYQDVFDLVLPRTTRAQAGLGRPIAFKELRPGDLVFFKPPTYPRHVGIFLSGSEFVHASKESGVTVSRIDKYYWGNYYWTARRILPATE